MTAAVASCEAVAGAATTYDAPRDVVRIEIYSSQDVRRPGRRRA